MSLPALPALSVVEGSVAEGSAVEGSNLFCNPQVVKNFHLILVFGWQVVFNSHFNVKIELVSHNILRLLEIFGPRKAAYGLQQS